MQGLNIFHVLIAIAMVALILIQKGAGATAGAAFGSGASGTVFGARGAGNFLTRSTWVLGALFCLISLSMAVMASRASLAPETDLGVVASAPVTEESAEQALSDLLSDLPGSELSAATEAAESSDLPSQDMIADELVVEDDAGDLPVIEVGPETPQAEDGDSSDGGGT